MLYLIGLGLSDETDITVKGLEIVQKASRVYLEAYTSILLVDKAILVSIFYANTNYELTLIFSRRGIMDVKS
jgi:diphthamide biosynthesis methyltransferase